MSRRRSNEWTELYDYNKIGNRWVGVSPDFEYTKERPDEGTSDKSTQEELKNKRSERFVGYVRVPVE
ncbi:hypothetical protein Avbf_10723 [Armadillidium vulgare]|nr:hypothetical protein Avbf_10723 [Armadillidium vulgare]